MRSGPRAYDWDAFERSFLPGDLVNSLQRSTIFGRGLPSYQDLQDPQTANAFSIVAQKYHVLATDVPKDIKERLDTCVRRGWLYSRATNGDGPVCYLFASRLHQWWVQWKLFLDDSWAGNVKEDDIVDFAKNVLQRFNPRVFTGQREIDNSGAVQRTAEAQYQDEFYRCCHILSGGSAVVFPEFGTQRGRVDFYVKSRKWAIELVRDGAKLQEHVDRFRIPSRYADLPIAESLVLDCRTSRPKLPHPGGYSYLSQGSLLFSPNEDLGILYHAVFADDYKSVEILDCNLNSQGQFALVKDQ
jgi:hypothetical protein